MKPNYNARLNKLLGIDLLQCHVLYELHKKRSPHVIQYLQDTDDNWFIHVITIKKASGDIIDCVMITANDLERWIELDKREGWEIQNI